MPGDLSWQRSFSLTLVGDQAFFRLVLSSGTTFKLPFLNAWEFICHFRGVIGHFLILSAASKILSATSLLYAQNLCLFASKIRCSVRDCFGMKKSVVVYGWIFAAHQLGSAVAAGGAGIIYKIFNSYSWAFVLAGMFCLLASLFVVVIKKQRVDVEVSHSYKS
jgi:hypothetical protein